MSRATIISVLLVLTISQAALAIDNCAQQEGWFWNYTCVKCNPGYTLLNNACLVQTKEGCASGCVQCLKDMPTYCLECDEKHRFVASVNQCRVMCPQYCKDCSEAGVCSECKTTFDLVESKCNPVCGANCDANSCVEGVCTKCADSHFKLAYTVIEGLKRGICLTQSSG